MDEHFWKALHINLFQIVHHNSNVFKITDNHGSQQGQKYGSEQHFRWNVQAGRRLTDR